LDEATASKTKHAWEHAESAYLDMLAENKAPPEIAREVLPIGLKAEIVVGANTREWLHIFGQRCSPKAHPRMRELMIPLLRELQERIPILFDRIEA
jgi:thymidylate synthase ThyX